MTGNKNMQVVCKVPAHMNAVVCFHCGTQALPGQNSHIIYVPVNGVKMLLIKFNHENCIVFYKGSTALIRSQNWG